MPVLRICIPAKVEIHAKCAMCLLACKDQVKPRTGYDIDIRFMCGKSNIDQARSMLTTDFYTQCGSDDLMLFIDSDHIFTIDDICNIIGIGGDIGIGVYPNAIGKPTCYMMDPEKFLSGQDNGIRYAGTGFMLIRHTILQKVAKWLALDGVAHARVSGDGYEKVVPFFKQRIIKSEICPGVDDWLGEDFTFCWLVRQCGGTIHGFLTKSLGHEVANIRVFYPEDSQAAKNGPILVQKLPYEKPSANANDEAIDCQLQLTNISVKETEITRNSKNAEIIYYCGHSIVQFSPNVSDLGGSEQAVVGLSRALVKRGYNVKVYGNVIEGTYDGVEYILSSKFDVKRVYERIILWRSIGMQILPAIKANHIYVDLHDALSQYVIPTAQLERVEKFFVKSEWHRSVWNILPKDKCVVIQNAIDVGLYDKTKKMGIERNRYKICYTSCYTRGLVEMLKYCWPIIKQNVPQAELHVCYGDNLVHPTMKAQIHEAFASVKNMGVINYGRLTADKVAELRASCSMHLYLCTVPNVETDCLSVRESFYSGCIPVVFNEGVFKERRCIAAPCVHTDPTAYQMAAGAVIKLMRDTTVLDKIRTQPCDELSWDQVGERWDEVIRVDH